MNFWELFSLQIFLLVIIFGLFFGLIFLPVILSFLGPSECHSHSTNEYQITPTNNDRKRRLHKNNDTELNSRECVSFIQTRESVELTDKVQDDAN